MVFLFYSQQIMACSFVRSEKLKSIEKNPANAAEIFIVRAKYNYDTGKALFRSIDQTKIVFENDSDCGFPITPDAYYIVLLENKFSSMGNKIINGGNSIILDLRKENFQQFSELSEIPFGQPNMLWSYCVKNEECQKFGKLGCGVNKTFLNSFAKYSKDHSNLVSCSIKPQNNLKTPRCIDNFCR